MIDIFKRKPIAFERVGVEGFRTLLEDQEYVLLDVRTPEEVSEGSIGDAIHLNYFGKNFQKTLAQFNREGNYLLYCRNGGRARKACNLMSEMGFENIVMLTGGMKAWEKANLKL